MNDACTDCATARTNGLHGIYRAGCLGCQTRGFARSTFAFDAVKTRSSSALRAALDKALPDVPIEDALSAVWDWWRLDHAEESTA